MKNSIYGKGKAKTLVVSLLLLLFLLSSFTFLINPQVAYAYSDENYQLAGVNFLEAQYERKGLFYENVKIEDTINLYDEADEIISKILIINRDDELDYVILDFVVDKINGFGINEEQYLKEFYGKGKIYYAGQLNFAYIENSLYYDLYDNVIDSETFIETMKIFKSTAPQEVKSGYNGILSWNAVNAKNSSYSNSDWDYIPGFNWAGLTLNSSNQKANYYSQSVFNSRYGVSGSCGPTAMTNMAVYYKWLGFDNALIDSSHYDTFDWFVKDLNWKNWGSSDVNWWTNSKNSFVNYAKKIGYKYDITNYNDPSFNDFKKQIANDRTIYTYLNVPETSGNTWAHAVVTVGFEQFTHTYQVNKRWWLFGWHDNWVTEQTHYYYLRCIDGWSTSNSGQFIDFNNFYTVMASAFKLK